MDPLDIDWERLDRYVAGEGSAGELDTLRRWVESDPRLQAIVETMRTAQRLPGAEPVRSETAASWQSIVYRLRQPAVRAPERPMLQLLQTSPQRRWMRLSAPLGAIAAAFLLVFNLNRLARESARRARDLAATSVEYVALRGQRVVVHLPDGTEATLAPETTLRLPPQYGQGTRAVHLSGRAYFVVTHDSLRPFSVETDRMVARDLGTRFAVRAYPNDPTLDVVVAEGKVTIGRANTQDAMLLEAGDRGRLTRSGELVRTRGVPLDQFIGWTSGGLVFHNARLRNVIVELERWYDVEIAIDGLSVGGEQVNASFHDEPATAAIGLVAAAAGLKVERTGSRFILRRNR